MRGQTGETLTMLVAHSPGSTRLVSNQLVGDQMTAGLISCPPSTPLRNVAKLMADHRVHAIFVFDYGDEDDESPELWGLVSDLDIAAAAVGDVDGRTAGDSAVTPLVTVKSDTPLLAAAQRMAQTGSSHLAVVDSSTRRPVGVLSTLDVARAVALQACPGAFSAPRGRDRSCPPQEQRIPRRRNRPRARM
jgi:CBS domain-containing protein